MSARAALDAARAVFEPSMGRSPAEATATPVWLERPERLATPRRRGLAMWQAAEHVLQAVVGRAELTGQALVGEARRLEFLTLGDAHALVALQGWVDRLRDATGIDADADAPPADSERSVAREAWLALEHAADRPVVPAPPAAYAPPAAAPTPVADSGTRARTDATATIRRPWYKSVGFLVAMLLLLLIGGAGAWWLLAGRGDRDFDDGVAAYERGAREVARMAFARSAQDHPDDARPLVFLGRLSREENDLARSRRFLEEAVRLDPANALAQRELASALLADGQPELARRFYVRAIELDPADRLAQGFLGCALFRLGRFEEARRWTDRAGPGDWTPCVSAPVLMPPPVTPPR